MTRSGLRIGIVSDSPALTTGYGIVTDQACRALIGAGHTPCVFGFKDREDSSARRSYPCEIIPIDPYDNWAPKLKQFVDEGAFGVLWIYMDCYCLEEIMRALDATVLPPTSLYAIFDGLPVYDRLLKLIERFDSVMVTTQAAVDYLGARGVRVDAIAPPGVDTGVFHSLDKSPLRAACGLEDRYVVGMFGRNTQRKQQPRLLQALAQLEERSEAENISLYFHCSARGYWDLEALAHRYGVRDRVLFADDLRDETRGPPLAQSSIEQPQTSTRTLADLSYVERLNLCDLVANAPHSGDFEQVLLEAPACGAFVLGTDDGAIMREALGPGFALEAHVHELGNTGQNLHHVPVEALARALKAGRDVAVDGAIAGREWAKAHPWRILHTEVVRLLEKTAGRSS